MKALPAMAALAAVFSFADPASAAIQTQTVTYQAGTVTVKGVLVYDDAATSPRPGVLVVPEWWGLTDYARRRAAMLAKLGYVAFVADMYGDGKTTDSADEAGKLAGPLKAGDRSEMRARVTAAFDQLKQNPRVDKTKLGAIGYCFGGTAVLELARSGADLNGVVSFHGGLDLGTAPAPTSIKPKLLIEAGGADPFVPPDQLATFEAEMKAANADYHVDSYPGAQHAFTNPDADRHHIPGIAYNKAADKKSWEAMKVFFAKVFR